jgi:glycosyltransferase involved in cell wall biosynthesis
MKMKICYVGSAASIHTERWVEYFAEKGHEVHWISLDPSVFNRIENVTYYEIRQFPLKVFNILAVIFKMKKLIKTIDKQVLHIHYAGTNGLVGSLSGFHPRIITAWGSDVLIAGRSGIKRPLVKFVLNKADLITCDADHMKKTMIRMGIHEKKIRIIYFGTDTTKFNRRPKNEALRKQLAAQDGPIIISLRSLEPVYDVESLIRAAPLVLSRIPNASFVVGGEGSQMNSLKELAESLGVSKNVRFTGIIANHMLPDYLNLSDIYVSTSLSDAGLAASTAEAMACALPVVVTDSGENSLWVKDGEGGFLVPVKNPVVLSEKILYLLKNPHKSRQYGLFNRRIIQKRNNYRIEMGKMERLYHEVVRPHGEP